MASAKDFARVAANKATLRAAATKRFNSTIKAKLSRKMARAKGLAGSGKGGGG